MKNLFDLRINGRTAFRVAAIAASCFALALLGASPSAAGSTESESGDAAPNGEVDALVDAIMGGDVWLDVRYRFENVDQDGFSRDADANTLRTRLGYKTAAYRSLSGLLEFEHITAIGSENFNSTINGRTAFPTVADPKTTEINQVYLAYGGIPNTNMSIGRRRIVLDNARFVGDVGFRQNQQTFDSALASNKSLPDTTLTYVFVNEVKRIFGVNSTAGSFNTESHLINGSYGGLGVGKITGYGYLLDIDDAATLSSQTFGVRFAGSEDVSGGLVVLYAAEYARQSDHGNNTADFDLNYYLIEPGVKYAGITAKLAYEVLEGNGSNAFQTPLATLHKFQGWADKFLTTPTGGIEDIAVTLKYKVEGLDFLDGTTLTGVYHDFAAENSSSDYGSEIDFLIEKAFFDHLTLSLKYADYDADTFATDTRKIWLTLGVKLP